MTQQEALFSYCLRLGDDALIHSYRLSEWCSKAPMLEEDLALTNFALDLTGRARSLFTYAGAIEGKGRTEDDLAYRRGERSFHNRLIYELPKGDFAFTMVRLLFTGTFEYLFYRELMHSKDETLAAVAAKTVKEAQYHMVHAEDWTLRLGQGTEESHGRMQQAVDELWSYTGELFETSKAAAILQDKNIAVDSARVKSKWTEQIEAVLTEAGLRIPETPYMHTGSEHGVHTEHLGHILTEMQYLQRAYPEATW